MYIYIWIDGPRLHLDPVFSRAAPEDLDERKFLCQQTKKKVDHVHKLIVFLIDSDVFLENMSRKWSIHSAGNHTSFGHYQMEIRQCIIGFERIYQMAEDIYKLIGSSTSWRYRCGAFYSNVANVSLREEYELIFLIKSRWNVYEDVFCVSWNNSEI